MALYLVTGGCGFIGSNVAHSLVEAGEDTVRIVDDLSTGREENIAPLRAARPGAVELWRGDIADPDLLSRALVGVDYVLHLAARPSVPWSIERPIECNRVNADGTLALLEAVRRHPRTAGAPIKRVVLATSSAAYGDLRPDEPKREDHEVAPLSPYAAAKLASEHHGAVYSRVFGVPVVSLRYFNVFGPRQDPTSQYAAVIPNFVRAALDGRAPTIYGDGHQSRDFVYVDDVIRANLLACRAPAERVAGQVFNIGCGRASSLLELLGALGELLGHAITPQHAPARAGEARHSCADIRRARELLGYEPRVQLAEGLHRTVAWFRTQRPDGAPHPERRPQ